MNCQILVIKERGKIMDAETAELPVCTITDPAMPGGVVGSQGI